MTPLGLALLLEVAHAEEAAVLVDDYRLEAGGHGLLSTGRAEVLPHGAAFARLWVAQTTRPLVAWLVEDPDTERRLVGGRQTVAAAWSMGLFGRAELGLCFPVVLHQDAELPTEGAGPAQSFGPADLTVAARALVLDPDRAPLGLAIDAPLTMPTGNQLAYMGRTGLAWQPQVLASRALGPVSLAAGAGLRLQPRTELLDLVDDDRITWRAAAELALVEDGPRVGLEALGTRALRDADRARGRASGELVGGVGVPLGPIVITAAGGGGILDGVGSPQWRALLDVSMRTREAPAAPPAPSVEELMARLEAELPPPPAQGPAGTDVAAPGPTVIVVQGPAPADADADRVLDEDDACPRQAGGARDGCPARGPQLQRDRLLPGDRIHFAHGEATLLPESFPVLQRVVEVLDAHPDLRVRIEGHADSTGADEVNLRLSAARAEAVRAWLVRASADPAGLAARLSSVGLGEGQPLDTNRTRDGRAENRRVELHVLTDRPHAAVPRS